MIVTFVGISGSGKSTLSQIFTKDGFEYISPDAIRKELTGNISDQSRNSEVFRIAHKKLRDAARRKARVVFDATNLRFDSLDAIAAIAKEAGQLLTVYIMEDSTKPDLCKERVFKDLSENIDRSDTVSSDVIEKQHQMFSTMLPHIEKWAKQHQDFATVVYYEG